jgi:hypothetical protein
MENNVPLWKRLWQGWKRIAAKIAHFQGHLLLSLIYLIVVTPLASLFKLFGQDPLVIKPKRLASFWVKRAPIPSVSEFLKREF